MTRNLASIRKISAIDPIPDADKIEVATVDGWKVVVQKGVFKVGDNCVYIEIDSILPSDNPYFEFLKDPNKPEKPIRIKTKKMRGQISQGIIFPLAILDVYMRDYSGSLTDYLKITQYEEPEPPANMRGHITGKFPDFIPKTEEERIQNLSHMYDTFRSRDLYATEKLDGTSATYFFNNGKYGRCSRNWQLADGDTTVYHQIEEKYHIKDTLTSYGKNIAVQGEIIGNGVSGNRLKVQGIHFFVFTIYDIDKQQRLGFADMRATAAALGLTCVPLIGPVPISVPEKIEDLILQADGESKITEFAREGVVYRDLGSSISFKVISNAYLLKHGL